MTPMTATQMSNDEDTEITLGTGKMLALFFGLVILCAIFFGMGFTMGKNSVRTAPELLPSPGSAVRTSVQNHATTPAASDSQPQTAEQTQANPPAANPDTNSAASAPGAAPASQ